jgi:hypothetical protein
MNPWDYINLTAAVQWVNNTGANTIGFAQAAPVMFVIVIILLFWAFGR